MAKIYSKTTWIDELPHSTPVKYRVQNETTLLEDAEISLTTPVTPGTPVNAANLNKIENGIDNLDDLVNQLFTETLYIRAIRDSAVLLPGSGLMTFTVPAILNSYRISNAQAAIYTASSSGLPTIQLHNLRLVQPILSTRITINVGGLSSYTASVPSVVNPTMAGVLTGDRIRVDVDVTGTGTRGLDIILTLVRAV